MELVDAFGCGLLKSGVVDCVPLSTYESSNDIKILVQPNPTSNGVELNFQAVGQQNTADLQIMNISGQVLQSHKIGIRSGSNQIFVDLSALNSSVYLMRIANKDFTGVVKVIKI
ncbi:MAG: T9SS type A sorting domain-containing protein [Saprospiraceae bacterium]|nr:T9SS type A sorting domain-containing protein [Candidatus Vicinibacter affinis]